MLAAERGARTASPPATTRAAAPTATGSSRAARPRRSSAAARCGGRIRFDEAVLHACAALLRRHARLHRLHAHRQLPPALRARRAARGLGAPRRRARVLDRGRHVHAPHEPRAGRHDARGRRRPAASPTTSRACSRAAPRSEAGRTAPAHGLYLASVRVLGWVQMLRVLLTNDDGIDAEGLQALRRALLRRRGRRARRHRAGRQPLGHRALDHHRAGRCGSRRSPSSDGTVGYASDGTPVDCVRLAALGLIDGFEPDLVVSGINHGSNLGDDITYSGTVAAALEGDRARPAGDRRLPAVAGARDGLPARRARSTSPRPRRSWRGSSTGSTTCRCPRARC